MAKRKAPDAADEPELEPSEDITPDTSPDPVDSAPVDSAPDDAPEEPPHWQSLASKYGIDAQDYESEEQFFSSIAEQQARRKELEQYADLGRQFIPYASQFQEFLTGKQQPQKQEETPFYKPPEYNQAWLTQVDQDEKGNLIPRPGADPSVVPKLQKYIAWRNDFTNRPHEYFQAMQQEAWKQHQPEFEKLVDQRIQALQEQRRTDEIIREREKMLFVHDANGKRVVDPKTGQPTKTEEGRIYAKAVEEVASSNLPIELQDRYAMGQVYAYQKAKPTPDSKKRDFLKSAVNAPNHSGSTVSTPNQRGETQPQNGNLSLYEQLRAAIDREGITDEMISGNY